MKMKSVMGITGKTTAVESASSSSSLGFLAATPDQSCELCSLRQNLFSKAVSISHLAFSTSSKKTKNR